MKALVEMVKKQKKPEKRRLLDDRSPGQQCADRGFQ
jgi:hypothetical protein